MRLKAMLFLLAGIAVLLIVILWSFFFGGKNESLAVGNSKTDDQMQKENKPSPKISPRPNIISRRGWNAKEPLEEMKQHTPQRITIHHTASLQKEGRSIEKKMQDLQNFSQKANRLASGQNKPAWPDVPYHYFIAADGTIAEGRDTKYVGDTNTEYDPTGHVLVVLEGNFEEEQPTVKQLQSLYDLVSWLAARWQIPESEIKGHNDYASTACPGKKLKDLLPMLRQKINDAASALHQQ